MRDIHLGRLLAVCAVATTAAAGIASRPAQASGPNTYSEYTVRTAAGTFEADNGSASTVTPMSGGEPSIGFDNVRNAAMYGSGLNVKRLTFDDSVSPATMTVADAKPTTSITTLDAITTVDPYTFRSFNAQLLGGCSATSFSDNAGSSWTPSQGCGFNSLLDHETLGGGPPHSPVPQGVGVEAVYYCAQNGYNEACGTSLDGGITFGPGVYVANTAANDPTDPNPTFAAQGGACSALTGHVRVAPDGTAYVPLKGCGGAFTTQEGTNTEYQGGTPALSVTTDNGTTWTIHKVPSQSVPDGLGGSNTVENPDESDPSVGISKPSGVLYFGWENGHNPADVTGTPPTNGPKTEAMIAVSHNHGTTWSTPVDLSSRLGLNNVQFPEVIAGDDDRAAFAFIATPAVGDDQVNSFPRDPPWHLYISTTLDGGVTWTTVDATPVDLVQRGCVDLQGTTVPPSGRVDICSQRNMLDFNDITLDKQGRVLVAISDGCGAACQANPASPSSGAVNRVIRQEGGTFLLRTPAADVPEGPLMLMVPLLGGAASLVLFRSRRRVAPGGREV